MSEQDPVLRDLTTKLHELYGERLVKLVLFGSRARGDHEPDSDYDVLIVLKGSVDSSYEDRAVLDDITEICLRHTAVIQWLFVSEERYRGGKDSLMWNVRHDGVSL